ncbi:methyltransferase, TIGR04325 family [Acinetobacter sp. CFCC 10889]|uniref:methyltransferase, TIGR04325 family n=1 Tax=Acinetobacter sp. CFCC 10889 TaxID=1775557 RepID=UPI000DCFF4C4|nr:methyltransferase, TIGR04325 family [Acinetobacter sp. CFCC 10889]
MKFINWFLVLLVDIKRYLSFNYNHGKFKGIYSSFDEATKEVRILKTYNEDEVVDSCLDIFSDNDKKIMEYEYPIFFWLRQIFSEIKNDKEIRVFDFGGRFGGHFFKFLPFARDYNFFWLVCEVEKMAIMGQRKFENEQLKFTFSFEDINGSDIFLSSGAIQYVDSLSLSNTLMTFPNKPKYILLARLPMQTQVKKYVTLQNQKIAFIPQYVFNKKDFIQEMNDINYELVSEWNDFSDSCVIPFHREKSVSSYTGLYFRLRDDV